MQRRRMPRNAKRASGAVVCAVALLSGCSGHPLADTAREALQAVTAGEVLPAPLARAYLLLGLSLALNAVMLLCWAGGQLARLGRLVRRMSARQKKEIVVKVEQMAPNQSTVQCAPPMPETPFIIPEPKTEIRAKKTGTEIQPAGKRTGCKAACAKDCALPGFVDSKNEEKTERNAGYLVVSQSGGGMLRQGTRKGIRRTPANRGMRAHRIVKGLDISEDVCHGMCP